VGNNLTTLHDNLRIAKNIADQLKALLGSDLSIESISGGLGILEEPYKVIYGSSDSTGRRWYYFADGDIWIPRCCRKMGGRHFLGCSPLK